MSSGNAPDVIVARLLDAIDRLWKRHKDDGGRYKEIILVGHSMGSVIVRKLAVVAHGEDPEAPLGDVLARFAGQRRDWAPAVRRIVLLAGMSRGWSPSSALNWVTTVLFSIGSFIGDTVFNGNLTIFGIRTQGAIPDPDARRLGHWDPRQRFAEKLLNT